MLVLGETTSCNDAFTMGLLIVPGTAMVRHMFSISFLRVAYAPLAQLHIPPL